MFPEARNTNVLATILYELPREGPIQAEVADKWVEIIRLLANGTSTALLNEHIPLTFFTPLQHVVRTVTPSDGFVGRIAEALLQTGRVDVHKPSEPRGGGTMCAIHLAPMRSAAAVQVLLKHGADPNMRPQTVEAGANHVWGRPLHLCCERDREDGEAIIQALLDGGADPEATNCEGRTPLELCLLGRCGAPRTFHVLVRLGADVKKLVIPRAIPGYNGAVQPLLAVCDNDDADLVHCIMGTGQVQEEHLCMWGNHGSVKGPAGLAGGPGRFSTLLHRAAHQGTSRSLAALLQCPAAKGLVRRRDEHNQPPLQHAINSSNVGACKALAAAGALPNTTPIELPNRLRGHLAGLRVRVRSHDAYACKQLDNVDLAGREGLATAWRSAEKAYAVRLDGDDGDTLLGFDVLQPLGRPSDTGPAGRPGGPSLTGMEVRLQGLTRQDLNGMQGKAGEYDPATGRYAVILDLGGLGGVPSKHLAVKPDNLTCLGPPRVAESFESTAESLERLHLIKQAHGAVSQFKAYQANINSGRPHGIDAELLGMLRHASGRDFALKLGRKAGLNVDTFVVQELDKRCAKLAHLSLAELVAYWLDRAEQCLSIVKADSMRLAQPEA